MKLTKLNVYTLLSLILGACGAGLYHLVYTVSVEPEYPLVIRGSLPEIGLWLLTAAVLAAAAFLCRKLPVKANANPPILACIAYALAAYSLTLEPAVGPGPLVTVYRYVTWAAAASMAAAVVLRLLKKNHSFLLDLAPVLLAVLHLVECYQLWSEVPLILDYVFGLGAVLSLALFLYHKLALRVGLPSGGMYPFTLLCGCYFCLVASVGSAFGLYFLGMGVFLGCMSFAAEA